MGWSISGCLVNSYTTTSLVCSCSHASDFAAWEAFVANLGGGEIGIIVTIAIVVVGILLPAIAIIYIIGMFWAIRRDRLDARDVHVGALLILTKNKLRMRAKQRRFFSLLRENAKVPQPLVVDVDKTKELEMRKHQTLLEIQNQRLSKAFCTRLPAMIRRWFNAILYDHSLFGIYNRFDPYYTRAQRFTVLVAILCGNIFISAFAYDLKFANNVSWGFMIAVAVVSSLIISIPVKMIVRLLFRQTEAQLGSNMDRVTQIYRVSQINQDLLPTYTSSAERADIEMLLAFRKFYILKADLQKTQKILQDKIRKPSSIFYYWNSRQKLTEELKKNQHISLSGRLELDDIDSASEKTLKDTINRLKSSIQEAKLELKAACESAHVEWSKVPRRNNFRVETLRKQQSTIMKFASLLYDESDDGPPRERRKLFSSSFIYVAWLLVFAYLIGTLAFSARWVLAITSVKSVQDVNALNPNDTIIAWIVSSFLGVATSLFIAEPLIQFIRFSLIPVCLNRFGSGVVSSSQVKLQVIPEAQLVQDEEAHIKTKEVAETPSKLQVATTIRESSGRNISKKAEVQDEFFKQQQQKKEGEHLFFSAIFDTLTDIVENFA